MENQRVVRRKQVVEEAPKNVGAVAEEAPPDPVSELIECGAIWRDSKNGNSMHLPSEGLALAALINEGSQGNESHYDVALAHLFAAIFMMPDYATITEMMTLIKSGGSAARTLRASAYNSITMPEPGMSHPNHRDEEREDRARSLGADAAIPRGLLLGMSCTFEPEVYKRGLGVAVLTAIALTGKHIVPDLRLLDLVIVARQCIQYGAMENLMLCFQVDPYIGATMASVFGGSLETRELDLHSHGIKKTPNRHGIAAAAESSKSPVAWAALRKDHIGDCMVHFLLGQKLVRLGSGRNGYDPWGLSHRRDIIVPIASGGTTQLLDTVLGYYDALHSEDKTEVSTVPAGLLTSGFLMDAAARTDAMVAYLCMNPDFDVEFFESYFIRRHGMIDHETVLSTASACLVAGYHRPAMDYCLQWWESAELAFKNKQLDALSLFALALRPPGQVRAAGLVAAPAIEPVQALWAFTQQKMALRDADESKISDTEREARFHNMFEMIDHRLNNVGLPGGNFQGWAPVHIVMDSGQLHFLSFLLAQNPLLANQIPPVRGEAGNDLPNVCLPDPLNYALQASARKLTKRPDDGKALATIGHLDPKLSAQAVEILILAGADVYDTPYLLTPDVGPHVMVGYEPEATALIPSVYKWMEAGPPLAGAPTTSSLRDSNRMLAVELMLRDWPNVLQAMVERGEGDGNTLNATSETDKKKDDDQAALDHEGNTVSYPNRTNSFLNRRFTVDSLLQHADLGLTTNERTEDGEDAPPTRQAGAGTHTEVKQQQRADDNNDNLLVKLTPLEIVVTCGPGFNSGRCHAAQVLIESGADIAPLLKNRCNARLERSLESFVFTRLTSPLKGIVIEYYFKLLESRTLIHTAPVSMEVNSFGIPLPQPDGCCYSLEQRHEQMEAVRRIQVEQQRAANHLQEMKTSGVAKKAKKKGGLGGAKIPLKMKTE